MKKLTVIAVLVMSMLVLMAGAAFAYGGPHQSFSATNNDGCAGCHVTHAASAAKLLNNGTTQTEFCFGCHDGSQSSLNVKNGLITSSAGTMANSTAGGFVATATQPAITSMHILGYDADIPGGGTGITGGLQCGSCHNPHGSTNSRILKVLAGTTAVNITVTENKASSYNSGVSQWCAGCHSRFNATQGSGHNNVTDPKSMYRHAMNVAATLPTGSDGSIDTGTPLESGNVACLTCHRAHSTTATMNGTYSSSEIPSDSGSAKTMGSVLLRMNDRGVCYNCHNGATKNLPQ